MCQNFLPCLRLIFLCMCLLSFVYSFILRWSFGLVLIFHYFGLWWATFGCASVVWRPCFQIFWVYNQKQRSSCYGTLQTDPTSGHEVAGLIPGLAQWVKDPVLLQLWCRPASGGCGPKKQKKGKEIELLIML